jgi:DNA-binding transcriptional MerR regulator
MDDHEDRTNPGGDMGLTELAEAAGVSVRTVRYYIAEGLLPPPLGAGPRAAYTAEHLDRLRLIARLKDAYLPLREIRRRLRGLDADAVRTLLVEDAADAGPPIEAPSTHHEAGPVEDSAAAYLTRLLSPHRGTRPARPERSSRSASFALERSQPAPVGELAGSPEQESERPAGPHDPASLIRADLDRGAALAALDALPEPDAIAAEAWHRLRLGTDAELLIRADAYERQREQIGALVAWARRILT